MSHQNAINLTDEELDKPIYRIMPVSRVKEILQNKQLTLVKPHKWDDPFENALLASAFSMVDGTRVTFAAKDSVYGQCWTLHRETDAMWRIYSHNKDGVRVTSTPRKLLEALSRTDPLHAVRAFIGKVSYQSQKNLLARLGRINLLDTSGIGVAESLLHKRNEFRHEAEVRLVYCGPDGECPNVVYQIPIDSNALFDKMLFDPRTDSGQYKTDRADLKKLGYRGAIDKSGLYKPPSGLLFTLDR